MTGYTVNQLMGDMRFKLNVALQEAGLSNTDYARQVINGMSKRPTWASWKSTILMKPLLFFIITTVKLFHRIFYQISGWKLANLLIDKFEKFKYLCS